MTDTTVLILMGSDSDAPVMQAAVDTLRGLGITSEMTVASAHRSPERVMRLVSEAPGPRRQGVHRRRRCRGASRRGRRGAHHPAGHRRAHRFVGAEGARRAAVDGADAARRAGRDGVDRQAGRDQRRRAGGADSRRSPTRRLPRSSSPTSRRSPTRSNRPRKSCAPEADRALRHRHLRLPRESGRLTAHRRGPAAARRPRVGRRPRPTSSS